MKKRLFGFTVAILVSLSANVFAATTISAAAIIADVNAKLATPQLTFTYNSPDQPWTAAQLATLKKWAANAYATEVKLFGNPRQSAIINIKQDVGVAGGDTTFPEITIGTFTMDTVAHEIWHCFYGNDGIYASTFKEGMAVAATIEVMKSFPNEPFGDRNFGSQLYVMYEQANKESIGSPDGNFFSDKFSNPGLRYAQAGYAWGKILQQDPQFLAKFNAKYFAAVKTNPALFNDLPSLIKLVKSLEPTIEGKPFDTWWAQQAVFSTTPAKGLQMVYSAGNYAAMVYFRNADGSATMLPNVTVYWTAYDCYGTSLAGQIAVTDSNGWVSIPIWNIGNSYTGKINLSLQATVGGQSIERTVPLPSAVNGAGVFGVTQSDVCTGSVTLAAPTRKTLQANIVNGAFSFPAAMQAGKFTIKNGTQNYTFNKDASSYFVYAP